MEARSFVMHVIQKILITDTEFQEKTEEEDLNIFYQKLKTNLPQVELKDYLFIVS